MSKRLFVNPDPGVAKLVELLESHGFEVVDCCDGESGEFDAYAPPTAFVVCSVDSRILVDETHRLHSVLLNAGVDFDFDPQQEADFKDIQCSYSAVQKFAHLSVVGIKDKDVYSFTAEKMN